MGPELDRVFDRLSGAKSKGTEVAVTLYQIVSEEASVGTHVRIEQSTLRGSAGTSLVIFTRGSEGTVRVQGSTIDYPNGVNTEMQ